MSEEAPVAPEEAPVALAMCRYVVSAIVDDVDAVDITPVPVNNGLVRLDVRVAKGEMGRVIGKRGRVAHAIRTLVRAAGSRDGKDIKIEFVD